MWPQIVDFGGYVVFQQHVYLIVEGMICSVLVVITKANHFI